MKCDNTKLFSIAVQGTKNPTVLIDNQPRESVEVPKGSLVKWSVSAEGYHEQRGDIVVVSDIAINIQLRPIKKLHPDEGYMTIRPNKGAYRIKYDELFKNVLPPVEGHDDEYLYCKDGYLWWKKLEGPFPPCPPCPPGPGPFPPPYPPHPAKPCYEMAQTTGIATDVVMSQKAISDYLNTKANSESVYSKAAIDEMMSHKADKDGSQQHIIPPGNNICVMHGIENFKKGEKVLFNNCTYEVGVSAFSTIREAVNTNANVILIGHGEYREDIVVPNKYTTLIGFEGALIRGKITFLNPTGCGLIRLKLVYECSTSDVCEDTDTAIQLEGDFNRLTLDDIDVVVKGTGHAIYASGEATNVHIENSRFAAGFLRNKDEVPAFVFQDFCYSEIKLCSIFGGLIFSGVVCDSSILGNTIIANKGVVIKFVDCSLERKINIYENRIFGTNIDYVIEWNNVKADDLTVFNIVGNPVAYKLGFIHLLNGQTGLINEKVWLAYNTCNNTGNSKFFVDDNEEKANLTPDIGNLYASAQAITPEEVEALIAIETERAKSIEQQISVDLQSEIVRSVNADSDLNEKIKAEIIRASTKENTLEAVKADKATTLAGYGIEDAYTKEQIDAMTTGMFHYKGQVQKVSDLPTEGMEIGDVYNVVETGANYCWSGKEWDKLSETIDLTPFAKKVEVAAQINEEAVARQAADETLSVNLEQEKERATEVENALDSRLSVAENDIDELIESREYKLTSANAGEGIKIERTTSGVVISSTNATLEWGEIGGDIADQADLQEELALKATVEDLNTEVSRATETENALDARVTINENDISELIETKEDKLTELNAGEGIRIERTTSGVLISSTNATLEWGEIGGDIADQADLQEELALKATVEDLNSETTRATEAENTLKTDLEAEISRATDAENTLTANLFAEESRAEAAEDLLDTRLTNAEGKLETLESAKEDKLTSANAGEGIKIERTEEGVLISSTNATLEWGEIGGNLSDQADLKEALDNKEPADANIVKYQEFGDNRKTIQLDNHNNISGIATDGTGHNLAMISKWDVADFGAVGVHMNMNTKDVVTVNDKDLSLTDKLLDTVITAKDDTVIIEKEQKEESGLTLDVLKLSAKQYDDTEVKADIADLQTKTEDNKEAIETEASTRQSKDEELKSYVDVELSKKEPLDDHSVRYQDFEYAGQKRKTIQLANHNNISGIATDGTGHNLAMVSKWDVADFGAAGLHMNLNSKDVVTVNDTDVVLTDKLLGQALVPGNDTVNIVPEEVEIEGRVVTINKITAKQFDARDILEELDKVKANVQENKEDIASLDDNKADKATTLAGYGITNAYTKEEVDAKTTAMFHYKGQVATVTDLPTEGMEIGDVYNVIETGANYCWSGSEWDKLSETIDLTPFAKKVEVAADLLAEKERAEAAESTLDLNKADLTYVNEELAKKEDADPNIVKFSEYPDGTDRKAIVLKNHDSLTGTLSDGSDGANLIMLSKWNVTDVGSVKVHMNLNTKDIVTVNDSDIALTDKFLGKVILAKDDSINIEEDVVEEGGISYKVQKLSSKEYDDTEVRGLIAAEAETRLVKDTELANAISTETSSRESADSDLEDAINTEKEARIAKDSELSTALSEETTARETADSALEDAIGAEEEARIAKDNELDTAISTEANTREAKDTELAQAIATESASRESKESELEQALAAEATTRGSKDTELETAISTEATTRASEDTRILAEAKGYTDSEIQDLKDTVIAELQSKVTTLTAQVNKLMAQMEALRIDVNLEENEITLIGKDAEPTV